MRRWSRIFRLDARAEVEEELAFHLERRERDYVERGLDPDSAREAAQARLGDLRRVSRECAGMLAAERRGERRREWLRFSWLDFKVGFRLLRRYPGLTVVGGLAMAFGIAVGAGAFEVVRQLVDPRLPLEGGERLVAVRHIDAATARVVQPHAPDFARWREQLSAVEDLGAYRTVERNLTDASGSVEPVRIAEISAAAFRAAPVPPLLGRALQASDDEPDAPAVVVLGHEIWQRRFGGDSTVVGRTVRLDGAPVTVVGVMPDGFAFPVAHRLWIPLRLSSADYVPGEAPALHVFGRLRPGASLEMAQSELAALGARAADEFAATHAQLRPEVVRYAHAFTMLDVPGSFLQAFYAVNLFFVLLLILVCANVALLMFARATAREGEIVVRTALGASRGRIVTQLFVEALVLSGIAAVIGLTVAHFAIALWVRVYELDTGGQLPFWFGARIAPLTMVYAVGLTLLAATVAGVLPALKMTGRTVEGRLRQLVGPGAGPRFGRLWTAVIIAQVAVAVAFPASAFFVQRSIQQVRSTEVGFATERFLSMRLVMDDEGAAAMAFQELKRRLLDQSDVVGVTFVDRLPRTHHPSRPIDTDDDDVYSTPVRVSAARIDPDYFNVVGAPVRVGRGFTPADVAADSRPVIVNASFVERVLGGRNAIGRRVRYAGTSSAEPGPWHEVVGVVDDLGMIDDESAGAGFYLPATSSEVDALHVIVHARGQPAPLTAQVRALAASIDPALRLHDVLPLDEVGASMWLEFAFLFKLLVAISAIALILSLAGIYAITSFTVARRTREIGVRIALGIDARRLIATIFARPVAHVATGVAIGGGLAAALAFGATGGAIGVKGAAWMIAYAALMLAICLLACVVPVRRALSVQPVEALKSDA